MRQRAGSLPCVCKGKKYVCTGYNGIIAWYGDYVTDLSADTGIFPSAGTDSCAWDYEQV